MQDIIKFLKILYRLEDLSEDARRAVLAEIADGETKGKIDLGESHLIDVSRYVRYEVTEDDLHVEESYEKDY